MFWDYKNGIFSFVSSRFFAFTGKSKGKFEFKGFKIDSKNDRLCLAMVPLDKRNISNSDSMIIVVGENSYHDGDNKLIKGLFLDKYFTYYPGKTEQMSIKRIPSSVRVQGVNLDMDMPYHVKGEISIYAMYPNGTKRFISRLKGKNNRLRFNIKSGKYGTCYYLLQNK